MASLLSAQIRNHSNSHSINHSDDDDDPLIDESLSIAPIGRTTAFYTGRQKLRNDLKNFFMDPFEKYQLRGRLPWKLMWHIFKIVFLTTALLFFGQDKFKLRSVLNAYQYNLGCLLIKNYEAKINEEGVTTLPTIQKEDDLADYVVFSLVNYFNLTQTSIGIYGFNVDPKTNKTLLPEMCISKYEKADIDVSQWKFDIIETINTSCYKMNCSEGGPAQCREKVLEVLPDSYDGFVSLNITMVIRSIFLSVKAKPSCVELYATSFMENTAMSGGVISSFQLISKPQKCNKSSHHKSQSSMHLHESKGQIAIGGLVVTACCITSFLIWKRIVKTYGLFKQTRDFYSVHYNRSLMWAEMICFVHCWDIYAILTDIITFLSMVFKMVQDLDAAAETHLDITAVLLGSAVAMNYVLGLRFLSFDKGCYILVLTISVAFPNILRFLVCIIIIYMGFVFCGWVVFAPYTWKFNSIAQTTQTLFALINGDEILDTYAQINDENFLLRLFSRAYFYILIMLFTYVVLSVMISLISDAMVVAQNSAKAGIGYWTIGRELFPELQLGYQVGNRGSGSDHKPSRNVRT